MRDVYIEGMNSVFDLYMWSDYMLANLEIIG